MMSHKSKSRQQHQHSGPKQEGTAEEFNHGMIHVKGSVEIDLVKDLREQQQRQHTERTAQNSKQLLWTKITAVLVFIYAGLTFWQAYVASETYATVNRPYVGVSAIGTPQFDQAQPDKGATTRTLKGIHFEAEFKNFGAIPAENVVNGWRVFFDGTEQWGHDKIPDKPSVLYQGEVKSLQGNVRGADASDIFEGRKTLEIEIYVSYFGPASSGVVGLPGLVRRKNYRYCEKVHYAPDLSGFFSLGPTCTHPYPF